ncbi:MAG: hypothetical protein WAV89_00435 [Ignavibacteriaceae bacterium]
MFYKRLMKNIIILVAIFIASSQFILAQDAKNDKQLNEIVSTLKQKVLLSNDQEAKVLGILSELKNNISAKPENKDLLVKDAQTKVESLLDKKQKMKYDILKNDLWKKIAG